MPRRDRNAAGADMSVTVEEGTDIYDTAERNALDRLASSGLSLRAHPPRWEDDGKFYDGRVPVNIGSLKPNEIGEYYGLQVDYTDYVEGQTVLARAEMLSAEAKLELVKAAVRKAKVGTAQEKLDLSVIDIRYVEGNAAYIEARTYYELMASIGEAARRDVKWVSRIIETKKMELEMGGRGGSINRVPVDERPGADRFRRRRGG